MVRMALLLALLLPGAARADGRWDRWQVLMWQDRTPAQIEGLAALGFTGGMARASMSKVDGRKRAALQAAGLSFYLENIATDFYSAYHRYTPGRAVTWTFDAAKGRYRADPKDRAAFIRDPGLSDPAWLERVRTRLTGVAAEMSRFEPLFYNLGDETGIGDLAAAWDFDVGPASLAGMRAWLRGEYGSLDALNRQWGRSFASWDAVEPELTDAALRRTDGNYSAWSDFKAWMDVAFARAVRAGTDALHDASPSALAAIEGAQTPGWGGYDYGLLAPAVDVMEIYDFGNALDLAQAFNPALIALRTSFGRGPREVHAAWRSVLHGGRGMVIWDEADDVVLPDGRPGARGLEIAALAREIGAVMPALREGRPSPDPVAVLYSQESFRVQWLLDRRAGDHDWAARDAEREGDDNAWRASRRVIVQRLAAIGVQPRFVSGAMLARGALDGVRVLILPHAIALSDAEVEAIRAFRAGGGAVFADTEPGAYDGHGRRRDRLPLPDVPCPAALRATGEETDPDLLDALASLLREAGAAPRVTMVGPDGRLATGVEARWLQAGGSLILSLQAGRPWGAPGRVGLRLGRRVMAEDLRRAGRRRVSDRIEVALDGVEPTILRLSPP